MKLISVQSRGDRLVKIWQTKPVYEARKENKKPFAIYKGEMCLNRGGFKFVGESHFYQDFSAFKAAAEWLEGATI